jgi:hypothetical protein
MNIDSPEGTRISGISRSNEKDQRVELDQTLSSSNFILHVYLFALYQKDAGAKNQLDLFAPAAPIIQVSMPTMPLDKTLMQVH